MRRLSGKNSFVIAVNKRKGPVFTRGQRRRVGKQGKQLSPGAGLRGGAKLVTQKIILKLFHNNSRNLG